MSEREAPYPADTRAKGWRFELDLEQIDQSDTWALTPPEFRPWLLMLWASAWRQTPCGSLPDDDALIAVRIGMKEPVFAKQKTKLLRGWWKATDGRLYHDTIAKRVTEMIAARNKERDRKAKYRERKDADEGETPKVVPPVSHGTNDGQNKDSYATDGTSTSTSDSKKEPPIPPDGGLPEPDQAKGKKRPAIGFQRFLDDCKAIGELPIPEDDSVFKYADETGIPIEFLRLHWLEFKERYTVPDAKRYKDWRSVYRKSVRGCWFKLWYLRADGTCGLTTQGEQAKRHHGKDLA
ncbi:MULTISPECIES: DUF1376 domain-containing protein [unclassified Burkholderia]|uniref:DUF1376 domain-containing protein n=1 Tax=unclassified Burkholderia TaxID=2613784 RepID=UPI000F5682C3|nr:MULTISPECIES: DUF1376 domain-containing protein [unclassified Burkholderia]RQR87693.1 DUF1376 domain-containing protein [Burkholderia sp. Bp9011]RQR97039.1 DUF1376 domain-containing protein [Burkholderia sp. Bp9010]